MSFKHKVDKSRWIKYRQWARSLGYVPHQVTFGNVRKPLEYGTDNIPARPHLRPVIAERKKTWASWTGFWFKLFGTRRQLNAVLERIGKYAVVHLRQKIDQKVPPPNAPSTIRKKGFDHPLIETGTYKDELDWKVE